MQRVTQRLQTNQREPGGFSKVRKQRMEPLAVRPLIDEAWSLVAIDEKVSGVEFLNSVRAEHRVIGNPDRLVQVFVNLLRNALNAIGGAAGQIEVRSRRVERGGRSVDRDHGGG